MPVSKPAASPPNPASAPNIRAARLSRGQRSHPRRANYRATLPAPPPKAAEPRPPQPAPLPDPRRPGISRYINEGIENTRGPAAAESRRPEIEARITAELAKDPEGELPGTEIIATICKPIGLPLYSAHLGIDLTLAPQLQARFARAQSLRHKTRSTGPPRLNPEPTTSSASPSRLCES